MFTYPPICRLREVFAATPEKAAIKKPVRLRLASRVRVHSLESRKDLNEQLGSVFSFGDNEYVSVVLDDGQEFGFRRKNLAVAKEVIGRSRCIARRMQQTWAY